MVLLSLISLTLQRSKEIKDETQFKDTPQLFLSVPNFKECLEKANHEFLAKKIKHVICEGNNYMLVRMDLDQEPVLSLLNEKNQAFNRVAKYHKYSDHIMVLMFSSYKFGLTLEEIYRRYKDVFARLTPK